MARGAGFAFFFFKRVEGKGRRGRFVGFEMVFRILGWQVSFCLGMYESLFFFVGGGLCMATSAVG